jgi:hypothetical protein
MLACSVDCLLQAWSEAMFDGPSLTSYVSSCSGGLAALSRNNSRTATIRLPCTGMLDSGDVWVHNSCSGDNLMRLAAAADKWVRCTAAWQGARPTMACSCLLGS